MIFNVSEHKAGTHIRSPNLSAYAIKAKRRLTTFKLFLEGFG